VEKSPLAEGEGLPGLPLRAGGKASSLVRTEGFSEAAIIESKKNLPISLICIIKIRPISALSVNTARPRVSPGPTHKRTEARALSSLCRSGCGSGRRGSGGDHELPGAALVEQKQQHRRREARGARAGGQGGCGGRARGGGGGEGLCDGRRGRSSSVSVGVRAEALREGAAGVRGAQLR
jgi:hypothetical protein